MKKLGITKDNVLVQLTPDEFFNLVGKNYTIIPDETEIDITNIKYALDFLNKHLPTIKQLAMFSSLLEEK